MKKRKQQQAEPDLAVASTPEGSAEAEDTVEAVLPDSSPEPVAGDDDVTNRIVLAPPEGQEEEPTAEQTPDQTVADPLPAVDGSRLESILESLLFAADRPLVPAELKRLLGERDGKRLAEALENLRVRHADSGIQLVSVAGGWQFRTHPANGAWVAKLVAGRPPRLSRAMMETLSIVAYRQPITRPEIDEIRGVDCGPVLRTLLDRGLIRVIGKREEVGRPILYGTTPEFLKIFSLRDLAELPTLREFHELAADDRAKIDSKMSEVSEAGDNATPDAMVGPVAGALPDIDPDEEDALIDALDRAAEAAGQASRTVSTSETVPEPASDPGQDRVRDSTSSDAGER